MPFVGTVPAIKPACTASVSRLVSVLGTEVTVKREYTRRLIRDFAQGCEVKLVGSARLAGLAEAHLRGKSVDDGAIAAEIAPCFVDNGARTDAIVLACTHYPLLQDRLEKLAAWPVAWIDPAPAIARRVVALMGPAHSTSGGGAVAEFTSGRAPQPALATALTHFGIGASQHTPDLTPTAFPHRTPRLAGRWACAAFAPAVSIRRSVRHLSVLARPGQRRARSSPRTHLRTR